MSGWRNSHGVVRLIGLIDRLFFRPSAADRRHLGPSEALQRKQLDSEDALQQQRQAAAAKERSLVLQARATALDSYAGVIRKVVPMVALAYGLSVSFSYFFLAINFFPSGLSLGDTLLYVFIALGYGLLSLFFISAGLLAMLPVFAFDEGARHRGRRLGMAEGRGAWIFPPLISPLFIAAVGYLFMKAFEEEANEHTGLFVSGFLLISFVVGVVVHRRAWRLGAGEPSKWSLGWDSWLLNGLANGFVFQGLYGFLIMAYREAAIIPIMVSACAGITAWMAVDFASSRDGHVAKVNRSAFITKVKFGFGRLGTVFGGVGVFCAVLAGCLHFFTQHMHIAAFVLAALALACWILLITAPPLFFAEQEEVAGPFPMHRLEDPSLQNPGPDGRKGLRKLAIPIAVAFSIPLIADLMYMDQKISILVFNGLGLREENTTVRLKGEALASLKAQARNSGIELSICTESDGSATIAPVNVLWHGLGQRSLLSIGTLDGGHGHAKEGRKLPQVEVASEEMKVLRNHGSQCRDVSRLIYFGSGKAMPVVPEQAQEMIKEVESAFLATYPPSLQNGKFRWVLNDIIVTGFADPMQLGEAGNEFLARRRAACMADKLFDSIAKKGGYGLADFNLRWDGEGARSPFKTSCPLTGDHAALAECHAANRVVKVRLIFSCQGMDGAPSGQCRLVPEVAGSEGDAGKLVVVDQDTLVLARASASAAQAKKLCAEPMAVR